MNETLNRSMVLGLVLLAGCDLASEELGSTRELWRWSASDVDDTLHGMDVTPTDDLAIVSCAQYDSHGQFDPSCRLRLLDEEGDMRWESSLGGWSFDVAADPLGNILVLGRKEDQLAPGVPPEDNPYTLSSFDSDGHLNWQHSLGPDLVANAVTLGPDRTALVAGNVDGVGVVVSFLPSGEIQWTTSLDEMELGMNPRLDAIAATSPRQIVIGGVDDDERVWLARMQPTGEIQAIYADTGLSARRLSALAVASSGEMYIARHTRAATSTRIDHVTTNRINHVDALGAPKWETPIDGMSLGLALSHDGTLYWSGYRDGDELVDNSDAVIGAIAPDGTLLWEELVSGRPFTGLPSVSEDSARDMAFDSDGNLICSGNLDYRGYGIENATWRGWIRTFSVGD